MLCCMPSLARQAVCRVDVKATCGTLQDWCQRQADNVSLSVLRVGFTSAPLRRLPLGSTLLEDLLQSLLLNRSATPEPTVPLTIPAPGGNDTSRQRSYTEQMLDAAVEPPHPSAAVSVIHRSSPSHLLVLR